MHLIAHAVTLLLCPLFSHADVGTLSAAPTHIRWGSSSSIKPGTYVFSQDTEITPSSVVVDGEVQVNDTGVSVPFSAEEAVSISVNADGDIELTPMLDDEERGELPEKLILAAGDFAAAGLVLDGEHNYIQVAGLTFGEGEMSIFSKGGHKHGPIGHCVGYVLAHLGIQVHGNGKDITGALMRVGFHQVSCQNPQVNDVASWTGGWHHLGHTAIWNGRCWAYDKGCGDPGHLYHLINCVHR